MVAADTVVRLEQGLWRDGTGFVEASVRVLTGEDEVLVADMGPTAIPAVRATALIAAACWIDGIGCLSLHDARLLSIGDRERCLLALYRLNFDQRLDAVVQCPATSCGETAEFELDVEYLFTSPEHGPEVTEGAMPIPLAREVVLATARGEWQVRFRVPNGSDQELAAQFVLSDAAQAADLILECCVTEVTDSNGQALSIDDWLPLLREPLSQTFSEIDAQANVTCALRCPACGEEFRAVVDAGTFLVRELVGRQGIFTEVDQLARAYHWSESEILALPVARRQRYLALVAGGN